MIHYTAPTFEKPATRESDSKFKLNFKLFERGVSLVICIPMLVSPCGGLPLGILRPLGILPLEEQNRHMKSNIPTYEKRKGFLHTVPTSI